MFEIGSQHKNNNNAKLPDSTWQNIEMLPDDYGASTCIPQGTYY